MNADQPRADPERSRSPETRDRLAPTGRPPGLPTGYQEWRRLLFLHWPVAVEAVRPLVPASLSLDLYDGRAYVTLLPFFVQAARPLGAPRALGLAFQETNVRTYVHVGGRDPGIYFFSLDAASLAGVLGARLSLGLPYFYARGRARCSNGTVDYRLSRLAGNLPGCHVRYRVGEPSGSARPGTLDHFLIERYLLHVQRGPTLWTVPVHHEPYPLHAVEVLELQDELVSADGIHLPSSGPSLTHYASGVDVEVFRPRVTLLGTTGNPVR